MAFTGKHIFSFDFTSGVQMKHCIEAMCSAALVGHIRQSNNGEHFDQDLLSPSILAEMDSFCSFPGSHCPVISRAARPDCNALQLVASRRC